MTGNRSSFRLWLFAFLGFFLLSASWAIAAPYEGPADESRHTVRAAGIFEGQVIAEQTPEGAVQDVPASLLVNWCFQQKATVAADCLHVRDPAAGEALREESTPAGRNNPAYYVVTSWPLAFWPNWTGVVLSRLLTGVISSALLACAFVAAARWTRSRAMVAGLIVGATPMVFHVNGSVNPQSLEIPAGAALFAAMMALVHGRKAGEGVNRAAVALAGISSAVIVVPRFTGIMWLVGIVLVALVPSSKDRLRELWRSATVKRWSVFVAVATAVGLSWTVLVKPADPSGYDHGWTFGYMARFVVMDLYPNIANQMVAVTGWNDTLMPRLIYVAWFMASGLLVLGGLVVGNRTDRWRLLFLFFGTFAPLLVLELLSANQIGWFNQGRYFLPGAIALPMLGAWIMSRRVLSEEQMGRITRMLAVLLLPIHLVCLAFTMTRWQSGLASINPFKGSWTPAYGSVLPLVLATVAVGITFVVYWRVSGVPVAAEPEPVTEEPVKEPIRAAHS
ncbi:hypothetical protein BBK82_13795 [Lentzea guizhouensis]|uniref:DUF2142 domain-containing protein n=1 Tax=Lentzea guizhouensis TaxID=1586287 RepID=A0A1B2HGY2_9PSEU|nr:DUF2142 domain-containing protein [Lentzea guizhouensis]ANZ36984.1 hypothetical protein BBK82_13795 [Lentzea guizhouensis]